MAILTRKKREIQEREGLILKAARGMLLELGYHGLTMARIADAIEYSKGTIYQHFPCKEDIIVALATESTEKQREMAERANLFRGRPRERMVAMGEATALFARLYGGEARIFQIMTGEAIMQKASPDALWRLKTSSSNTTDIMLLIVRDAIAQGDIELDEGTTPEDLIYPLWILGEGGKAAASNWLSPAELGIRDPFVAIIKHGLILADGYGWRPLSAEWDYEETLRRIRSEVFPLESKAAYSS